MAKREFHLRINNELYSKILELSELHKVTVNSEINNLLELSFKIQEQDKMISSLIDTMSSLKKDTSYIKQILIQIFADLNLETVDISSSECLEKFNKKYYKRNMND